MSETLLGTNELEVGKKYNLFIVSARGKFVSSYFTELAGSTMCREVVFTDRFDATYFYVYKDYKVQICGKMLKNIPQGKYDSDRMKLILSYTEFFIDHAEAVIIPINSMFSFMAQHTVNPIQTELTERYNHNYWVNHHGSKVYPIRDMDDNYIINVMRLMERKSEENYFKHQELLFKKFREKEISSKEYIYEMMELSSIDPNTFYMSFKIYRYIRALQFIRVNKLEDCLMSKEEINSKLEDAVGNNLYNLNNFLDQPIRKDEKEFFKLRDLLYNANKSLKEYMKANDMEEKYKSLTKGR